MNSTVIGRYRWRIVALLFFATTICYIDRQVLSMISTDETFQKDILGLSSDHVMQASDHADFKKALGNTDAAFKLAYSLGFLIVGWFLDRVGVRKGFPIALGLWSLSGMLHGLVKSAGGLIGARFLLGIGEAGNFPSANKTISEWLPRKERSQATGIMNAGANIGVIATALAVPVLNHHFGWRVCFIVTGALGFILIAFWMKMYRKPRESQSLGAAELAHIESDMEQEPPGKVSWIRLFGYRQTWAFAGAKFLTDSVWYFFLTWLPLFFVRNNTLDQKLDISSVGFTFVFIYIISDVGSIFFGWLTTRFMKNGWSLNRARKTTLLLCGLCALPIFFAAFTTSFYVAVLIIALGTAAHQGFSSNILTMPGDLFPKYAVGSVTGIGGTLGGIAGAMMTWYAGHTDSYVPFFIYGSTAYLIATLVIHLCVPKMERAQLA